MRDIENEFHDVEDKFPDAESDPNEQVNDSPAEINDPPAEENDPPVEEDNQNEEEDNSDEGENSHHSNEEYNHSNEESNHSNEGASDGGSDQASDQASDETSDEASDSDMGVKRDPGGTGGEAPTRYFLDDGLPKWELDDKTDENYNAKVREGHFLTPNQAANQGDKTLWTSGQRWDFFLKESFQPFKGKKAKDGKEEKTASSQPRGAQHQSSKMV